MHKQEIIKMENVAQKLRGCRRTTTPVASVEPTKIPDAIIGGIVLVKESSENKATLQWPLVAALTVMSIGIQVG